MRTSMTALLAIAAAAAGAYIGAMAWQVAMKGQLPSDPTWYALGIPAALLIGTCFYLVRRIGRA